jgi:multiple sugar transport system permease protein
VAVAASTLEASQRRRVGRRRTAAWLPYLLIFPILFYEFLFIIYPIYKGVTASFTKQPNIGKPAVWVGLDNYQRMLNDENFPTVVKNTLIYMFAVIIIAVGFGLVSALLLNRPIRDRALARGIMTLPWAFPEVPTALVFLWMLNPSFGVINLFATWIPGVEAQQWLLNPRWAMTWVVLTTAWKGFPFYSLVLLAALQTVPQELHDAARVDGAGKVQSFFSVTLPCISPTLMLLTVLAAIFSFKQFTMIWLLTGGGASTETIVIRVYNTAFKFYNFPYASTFGVAGFLMAFTIALVFLAIQRQQELRTM